MRKKRTEKSTIFGANCRLAKIKKLHVRECVNTRGCHHHEKGLVEQRPAMRRPVNRRRGSVTKYIIIHVQEKRMGV